MEDQQQQQLPESFFCPLTQEVMTDPVVDPEGNTYERKAIEEWLKKEQTSPITRTPLQVHQLVPNRALRDAIEEKTVKQAPVEPQPVTEPTTTATTTTTTTTTSSSSSSNNNNNNNNKEVHLKVSASKVSEKDGVAKFNVLASICPPARPNGARAPVDVCCVIDVSGSMGEEAKMKKADGTMRESHGLSLLDVVKHAVKTIGHSLQATDRLALVAYSTSARTLQGLTYMTENAQKDVDAHLEKLSPEDTTNIWDGLYTGLEILRTHGKPGRIASLLLLTDGLPNVSPPRGEVAMFKRYIDQHQQLPCSVSTFGFGFGINSNLLREIAVEGDGIFSFIPDSSFVGTVFVNAVSNLLVTLGTNVTLSVEPAKGVKLVSVLGTHRVQNTSWGVQVNLPSLLYGQSLDVVFEVAIPDSIKSDAPYLTATAKFDTWDHSQNKLSLEATDRNGGAEVRVHTNRLKMVEGITQIYTKVSVGCNPIIAGLKKNLENCDDPREEAMLKEVTGQVTEAVDAQYYNRWGQHYLPSLARAHLLQQCNNFLDPAIQFYGGEYFRALRDVVEDAFVKLPPPVKKQVAATTTYQSYSYGSKAASAPAPAPAPAPVFSMEDYYDYGHGGCFDGNCSVRMANGAYKKVKDIAKGDRLVSPTASNEVVCVLKLVSEGDHADLVQLEGGLLVTPYHPVRINGKWSFPCDLAAPTARPCPAVYTFVLKEDSDHITLINGVECVTLGHNYVDDEVVSHPYFGTRKIVEDMSIMSGWEEGMIEIPAGSFLRDKKTGLVCGIRSNGVCAPLSLGA